MTIVSILVAIAISLNVCSTDCAVRIERNGLTVAKQQDFSDWQDCYVTLDTEGFVVELAGCAP